MRVSVNVDVQEQYWINVACRFWRTRTATGYWSSISHTHNREDSLLSHTSLRTDRLTISSLQVDLAALTLQHGSAKEAARRKSSVAKAWKSVLPALRQN